MICLEAVWLCTKSPKSDLDRVSTGSGSDLVSDQHPIQVQILIIVQSEDSLRSRTR